MSILSLRAAGAARGALAAVPCSCACGLLPLCGGDGNTCPGGACEPACHLRGPRLVPSQHSGVVHVLPESERQKTAWGVSPPHGVEPGPRRRYEVLFPWNRRRTDWCPRKKRGCRVQTKQVGGC